MNDLADFDDEAEPAKPERHVRKLGRYQICYEIAVGGMATVYLARAAGQAGFEKLVALKVILPNLARDKRFVEMFLDEARIAARINHPNVCSVFDYGQVDDTHYIAMEFIVGETLATVLRRSVRADRPIPPAYASRIVASAGEGLHAAHELRGDDGKPLGVVHRDVSPQNIFVAYDGSIRVVDFGIARAAGRVHQTQAGVLKGKLAYMPPEQLRRLELDRRADVWALGIVLWEILAGKRLFKRGTEVDTMLAVERDPIPRIETVRADVPSALGDIIAKALERDRDLRYPTARELTRELERFLATCGEPTGVADVSEWMEGLFADAREERHRLVADARTISERIEAPQDKTEPSISAVLERALPPPPTAEALSMADKSDTIPAPPLRRGPLLALLAIVAAVGLAIVGGIAWAVGGDADDRIASYALPDEPPAAEPAEGADPPEPLPAPAAPADLTEPAEPVAGPEAVDDPPVEEPERVDDPAPVEEPAPVERVRADEPARPDRAERPDRTEARPEPRERRMGAVNVVTIGGWAQVVVDGRPVGRTPTRIELPVGRRAIFLQPFGEGRARRVSVNVREGEIGRVVVRLDE